jgi:hypothetical protein
METLDLKKLFKQLYQPSAKEPSWVEVPQLNYLMVDGHGDPNNSPVFQAACEVLYSLSYTLKFSIKNAEGINYTVAPLEGLWWTDDMTQFDANRKDLWKWTLMIMQPDCVTAEKVQQATVEVRRKKDLPGLEGARFETFKEGLSAQILYIGPYSAERPTILRLHAFIREAGRELRGRHHEIYLSNPGRTAPEKLKTVIRQPAG